MSGEELHKEATLSPVTGGVILKTGVPNHEIRQTNHHIDR